MAARKRICCGLPGLLALLALLFLCAEVRAAVDVSYGTAARTQVQPGDTVLLYTGPAATAAEAKSAAAALVRERAYYEAQGAQVYAFGLGGLLPDAPDAVCTAIAPDAATLGMGMAALSERAAQADFDILCCNLTTAAGETVFLPGKLYGDVGVLAFAEPAALAGLPAESRAAYDMNGEVARVLIDYTAAQLRAQGASTTVLLAICPVKEEGRPWRGEDLRMQCTGIDVWIEAQAPGEAQEGPTAEGLVLYAAPGSVDALRIPGAAQAAAPVQTNPAKTARPTPAAKPTQTPQPTQTPKPVKTAAPTQPGTESPTETPCSMAETADNPPSGASAQARPLSPEEEDVRRALAMEEGQRRQDYIPPNAVYTGGALRFPLFLAVGALCFACTRTFGRKRGGQA